MIRSLGNRIFQPVCAQRHLASKHVLLPDSEVDDPRNAVHDQTLRDVLALAVSGIDRLEGLVEEGLERLDHLGIISFHLS